MSLKTRRARPGESPKPFPTVVVHLTSDGVIETVTADRPMSVIEVDCVNIGDEQAAQVQTSNRASVQLMEIVKGQPEQTENYRQLALQAGTRRSAQVGPREGKRVAATRSLSRSPTVVVRLTSCGRMEAVTSDRAVNVILVDYLLGAQQTLPGRVQMPDGDMAVVQWAVINVPNPELIRRYREAAS